VRVLPVLAGQDRLALRLDTFLAEMERLYARGARLFKFVDRTFNLNVKTSQRIMQFFLDKLAANPDDPVYAHFELVPDHLPEALKDTIAQFPPGALQFEIGIQSFNPRCRPWSAGARTMPRPRTISAGCASTRTPTCTST
jgi:hypothetical protein